MKYLVIALIAYMPIQLAYIMIAEAYENYESKLKGSKAEWIIKLYRYALAISCMIAVFAWKGAEPPVLDMSKLQTSEGIVECKNSGGKRSSGMNKMDGFFYKETFSNVFGTGPSGPCFEELNGHNGKIVWLPIYNNTERLMFQISNADTNRVYGLTVEKSYERHKKSIEDKTWFYLSKIALFLLALQFAFWERANKFHKLFELKAKKPNL